MAVFWRIAVVYHSQAQSAVNGHDLLVGFETGMPAFSPL